MSAQDHLGPQFMTAREIVGSYRPNDRLPKDSTDAGIWARKLADTKAGNDMVLSVHPLVTGSLHDHIAARGVMNPVTLISGEQRSVFDGHHRIAAMHDINPDEPLPVQHATDKDHARVMLNRAGYRGKGNRGR